jgi:hypothetical protein
MPSDRGRSPLSRSSQLPKSLASKSLAAQERQLPGHAHAHHPTKLMPDLLRVKQAFRQLAVPSQTSSRLHFRRSHGPAAASDQSLPRPRDSLNHPQPTVNNNYQPLRLRRHGFKSLPLSPLMRADEDAPPPVRRAQPPPPPPADEALKQFQKEVAMNPFGLSTP